MSIIVTKADHVSDITYELSAESGTKKEFMNKSSSLQQAERLLVEHNLRPNGAKGTDVHRVVFSKGNVDDVTGAFTLGSVEVIFRVPRADAFTSAVVQDLAKQAQCLLKGTFVDSLYYGITTEGDYHVDSFVPDT